MNYASRIILTYRITVWTTSIWLPKIKGIKTKIKINYKVIVNSKQLNLLVSQLWPSNNTLQSHETFPDSWTMHFPPCLHTGSLFGEHWSRFKSKSATISHTCNKYDFKKYFPPIYFNHLILPTNLTIRSFKSYITSTAKISFLCN